MARFVPPPPRSPCRGLLRASPSKSATHRALVLAGLAVGGSRLHGPLRADDTEATRRGLEAVGVEIGCGPSGWDVEGSGGALEGGATIDAGASGTTLRLLTAAAATGRHPSRLGGSPRLEERPMEPLLQALQGLGAHARRLPRAKDGTFLEAGGRPFRGGPVTVEGSTSSQFASALLVIGTSLPDGLDLSLQGPAVSLPYLGLTVEMLRVFGADVREGPARYQVRSGALRGTEVEIEGDWSSAAYPLAAAAVTGGSVTVEGLRVDSRQADVAITDLLRRVGATVDVAGSGVLVQGTGALSAFDVDLRNAPDLAPMAAVLALFAEGRSVLRGIAHLRGKESDRLEAIGRALRSLGREIAVADGTLVVEAAGRPLREAIVETAGDHRLAMAFAVASLRLPGLEVDDRACVAKSYPLFWQDLDGIQAQNWKESPADHPS